MIERNLASELATNRDAQGHFEVQMTTSSIDIRIPGQL